MLVDRALEPTGASVQRLGTESVFDPTFRSSRHEREWILNYLGYFYDDKQITDVLSRVKGGKEANVYCCAAHPGTGLELLAAKIYRPREFRQLRNDARYRQGRGYLDSDGKLVLDERLLAAVKKKTSAGRELVQTSWLEHEYQTLKRLHEAGADVPRPVSHSHNTILMEYLGDADLPAPALQAVRLAPNEVRPIFDRLLHNVALMLANNRIHADLSAFNVLYWEGEVRLIDFPQAVAPAENSESFDILERDVRRLCEYFERYGLRRDAHDLTRGLWDRYVPAAEEPIDWQGEAEDEDEA
jgi:RIO kinase 1